jgi:translation initiation factor 2 gamma subunit (eIF-2gamma)
LIGAKTEADSRSHRISKITTETLKFNVGSTETPGRVTEVKDVKNMIFIAQTKTTFLNLLNSLYNQINFQI